MWLFYGSATGRFLKESAAFIWKYPPPLPVIPSNPYHNGNYGMPFFVAGSLSRTKF